MNREKRLTEKHVYERIEHKPDIMYNEVKMIDDNGIIKTETQEILIDESESISQIPAYTTKIEYQELYGTIDKNNVIRYTYANPAMDEYSVMKIRDKILDDYNKQEIVKKDDEQKEEVKE